MFSKADPNAWKVGGPNPINRPSNLHLLIKRAIKAPIKSMVRIMNKGQRKKVRR